MDIRDPVVAVHGDEESVHVGPAGGYITFFSRVSDQGFFEFTMGAIGIVDVDSRGWDDDDVDVKSLFPFLIGLRHNILSYRSRSQLQPYLSIGVGPYFYADVDVANEGFNESVYVATDTWFGGYTGCGFHIYMARWFGLNVDLKYHFIQFNKEHDYSGLEFGFGIGFHWGR